jgi:hypothetical protein
MGFSKGIFHGLGSSIKHPIAHCAYIDLEQWKCGHKVIKHGGIGEL